MITSNAIWTDCIIIYSINMLYVCIAYIYTILYLCSGVYWKYIWFSTLRLVWRDVICEYDSPLLSHKKSAVFFVISQLGCNHKFGLHHIHFRVLRTKMLVIIAFTFYRRTVSFYTLDMCYCSLSFSLLFTVFCASFPSLNE